MANERSARDHPDLPQVKWQKAFTPNPPQVSTIILQKPYDSMCFNGVGRCQNIILPKAEKKFQRAGTESVLASAQWSIENFRALVTTCSGSNVDRALPQEMHVDILAACLTQAGLDYKTGVDASFSEHSSQSQSFFHVSHRTPPRYFSRRSFATRARAFRCSPASLARLIALRRKRAA